MDPVSPRPATVEDEAPSPVCKQPEAHHYPPLPASPPLELVKESTLKNSLARVEMEKSKCEKKYPCGFLGYQARPLTRHYDLERHYRTIHEGARPFDNFYCDYPECEHKEPLGKDHCREHYREYHMEDLIKRGEKNVDEFLLGQLPYVNTQWWRCNGCLSRAKIDKEGWQCLKCQMACETERRAWRQNGVLQPYQRSKHDRSFCDLRNDYPQGFCGSYGLARHRDQRHKDQVKKFICIEPIDGINSQYRPVNPLSKCKFCSQQKKKYGAYYNAAAHLRRAHFRPKARGPGRYSKVEGKPEERSEKGSIDWPPMSELKRWMKEVYEPVTEGQQPQEAEAENEDENGGSWRQRSETNVKKKSRYRGKEVRYISDTSDSDASTWSNSGSETDISSLHSGLSHRGRRDSVTYLPKRHKQDEKGYVMVEGSGRFSSAAHAPGPPIRGRSYQQRSPVPEIFERRNAVSVIGGDPVMKAYAAGMGAMASTMQALPPLETIKEENSIGSTFSSDGDPHSRLTKERRRELLLEELKLKREIKATEQSRPSRLLDRGRKRCEEYPLPDDFIIGGARDNFSRPHKEHVRHWDEYRMRRVEETVCRDSKGYLPKRHTAFPRGNAFSELPLDGRPTFNYVCNPFTPRRPPAGIQEKTAPPQVSYYNGKRGGNGKEMNIPVLSSPQREEEPVRQLDTMRKTRNCVVCTENIQIAEFPALMNCEHNPEICAVCYKSWIASELDRKSWKEIRCPVLGCEQLLKHSEVQQYAAPEVYARFDAVSAREALNGDSNFRWCRRSGCNSGQIHENGTDGNIFRCIVCGFKVCVVHDDIWHEGETCKEYDYRKSREKKSDQKMPEKVSIKSISQLAKKFLGKGGGRGWNIEKNGGCDYVTQQMQEIASARAISRFAKKCPGKGGKCGWNIEKNGGCDHMTCAICQHEFCWECMAPYDRIRKEGNTAHDRSCKYHSSRIS